VDWTQWTESKAWKDATISWARLWHPYSGMRVVLYSSINLKKGPTINNEYYIALLERLNDEIKKKQPHLKKKPLMFHQTMHRVTK
jgi:hypothetical protein